MERNNSDVSNEDLTSDSETQSFYGSAVKQTIHIIGEFIKTFIVAGKLHLLQFDYNSQIHKPFVRTTTAGIPNRPN